MVPDVYPAPDPPHPVEVHARMVPGREVGDDRGQTMPRVRPPSTQEISERRHKLHEDIAAGGIPVREGVKRMRVALGMTQARFGEVFKLTERQVWEIEAGRANPTLETLNRISKPFGFQAGFVLAKPK